VKGRVLAVAGSDSGGGAGIQADIKTVTALGGYAATAITAITAQNTRGVFGVHALDPAFVVRQLELVLEDIGADAIKTGMLHSVAMIDAVGDALERLAPGIPLVVDPVMIAKGGAPLLESAAEKRLCQRLVPRATLITPNAPEAAALTGLELASAGDLERAAERLVELGASAALVKGGHLPGERVVDVLATRSGLLRRFEGPRLHTTATHGTGCTLASAIATGIAQGMELERAIERARAYLIEAMRTAPGLGTGHGPLNHGHCLERS
jgi:hydroxymethylpyrimidine/phosphomethylpyrimidine kinase